ncbi:MAG: CsiV family protein [Gammaproteobacteria bacterium]|nr:CsiV family protein [Gammaproteobacteria bacterium]
MIQTEINRALIRALLIFAALVCGPSAGAQERWFQVEVIVFERLDDGGLSAESWLPDPGRPPVEDSIRLIGAEESPVEGEVNFAYRLLGPSQYSLRDTFGGLRASRTYRPLLHHVWRQPGLSQRRARWVHLYVPPESVGGFAPAAPRIDGTLRVYLSRYLHADADILYQREGVETPFRLQTSRRMRSGELHYLDHPLFGVLILVTPLPSASG